MDMVLNYPQVEDYLNDDFYSGATCGPVCNRISGAAFVLDDISYRLSKNDGDNCLHGGLNNISNRNWQVKELGKQKVEFRLELVHLEDDFPGDRRLSVIYDLTDDNQLQIFFSAISDRNTCILTSIPITQ